MSENYLTEEDQNRLRKDVGTVKVDLCPRNW